MNMKISFLCLLLIIIFTLGCGSSPKKSVPATNAERYTTVGIEGEKILINGDPTYKGRIWKGYSVEGLLFNSRMVQGIFDDLNEETRIAWKYPDTGIWDPDRNTDEFVAAMPEWAAHGMLGFTINLQGGSPMGYGNKNWYNSAFYEDGRLREEYFIRLEKILNKADELGMVPILGIFYFGQDQNLLSEAAVKQALANSLHWLHEKAYRNILIELANECNNNGYDHAIIKQDRVHELLETVKKYSRNGHRYPAGVSFNGNTLPTPNVVAASDFILIHGNGVHQPERITEMVTLVRKMPEYKPMPIIFNEDDHYDFEKPMNNMLAATQAYASWGFFDFRMDNEAFKDGFQSVPVNWGITSERKKGFFRLVKDITGILQDIN